MLPQRPESGVPQKMAHLLPESWAHDRRRCKMGKKSVCPTGSQVDLQGPLCGGFLDLHVPSRILSPTQHSALSTALSTAEPPGQQRRTLRWAKIQCHHSPENRVLKKIQAWKHTGVLEPKCPVDILVQRSTHMTCNRKLNARIKCHQIS